MTSIQIGEIQLKYDESAVDIARITKIIKLNQESIPNKKSEVTSKNLASFIIFVAVGSYTPFSQNEMTARLTPIFSASCG